jgi:hypothetical protein
MSRELKDGARTQAPLPEFDYALSTAAHPTVKRLLRNFYIGIQGVEKKVS